MGNGRRKRLFGILGRSVYSVFSALHCDYIEFKKSLLKKLRAGEIKLPTTTRKVNNFFKILRRELYFLFQSLFLLTKYDRKHLTRVLLYSCKNKGDVKNGK